MRRVLREARELADADAGETLRMLAGAGRSGANCEAWRGGTGEERRRPGEGVLPRRTGICEGDEKEPEEEEGSGEDECAGGGGGGNGDELFRGTRLAGVVGVARAAWARNAARSCLARSKVSLDRLCAGATRSEWLVQQLT